MGQTDRKVITYSPLLELQNWLFSVAYDRAAFEAKTMPINIGGPEHPVQVPLWRGYEGDATRVYEEALNIVRVVVNKSPPVSRLGIGGRHRRSLIMMSGDTPAIPSVFQLSSGETALLSLFLSILRDFDLRDNKTVPFTSAKDVRGLVVIDEVDLHLHAKYQDEVLPKLIGMFPQVQFVMTTHSPLLVLGLEKVLGERMGSASTSFRQARQLPLRSSANSAKPMRPSGLRRLFGATCVDKSRKRSVPSCLPRAQRTADTCPRLRIFSGRGMFLIASTLDRPGEAASSRSYGLHWKGCRRPAQYGIRRCSSTILNPMLSGRAWGTPIG